VILLHRGPALTAQAVWRTRVSAQSNIALRAGTVVEEIVGENEVRGVRTRNAGGEVSEIAVEGVYVYVGLSPNTGLFGGMLALDPQGAVITDNRLRSSARGIFAAGSVRAANSGQAAGAAGDGALAALAAHEFLASGDWSMDGR